jgi:hypothetical protein
VGCLGWLAPIDVSTVHDYLPGGGFTTLTCTQLGAEHPRQAGDGYIDDGVMNATIRFR